MTTYSRFFQKVSQLAGCALISLNLTTTADEVHRWTFEDGTDAIGGATLEFNGGGSLFDGKFFLDGVDDFAVTQLPLPGDLTERTLVAWVGVDDLAQGGGGVLTLVEGTAGADPFDGIVFGESVTGQWMNGSNGFSRSVVNNGGAAEMVLAPEMVMMAIVYGPGDQIEIYREGVLYSVSGATQGTRNDYLSGSTFAHFGQRHPGGGNRFFDGFIEEARIYDEALSAGEVAAIHATGPTPKAAPISFASQTNHPPLTGQLLVQQNDSGNTKYSVTTSLSETTAAGVSVNPWFTNRADYALNFPAGDDSAEGVLIASMAENGKRASVGTGVSSSDYLYLAVNDVDPGGVDDYEVNSNVNFGWFPYSDWLGALVVPEAGEEALSLQAATAGFEMGAEVVDYGNGYSMVNLCAHGANSQEGILLVSHASNTQQVAQSQAREDGTFLVTVKELTEFVEGVFVREPFSFVYIPQTAVGTKGLVAMGRIDGNGDKLLEGGNFTVSKVSSHYHLTIPGYSPANGNLLVSATGGDFGNWDNFVSAEWDNNGYWVVESLDTPSGLLEGIPAGQAAFEFALFENLKPTIVIDTDEEKIFVVDENGNSVDQANSFRGEVDYAVTSAGGLTTFTFGGDFVLLETDYVQCVGSNALSLVAARDFVIPEGAILDASARGMLAGPGGGVGGSGGSGGGGGDGGARTSGSGTGGGIGIGGRYSATIGPWGIPQITTSPATQGGLGGSGKGDAGDEGSQGNDGIEGLPGFRANSGGGLYSYSSLSGLGGVGGAFGSNGTRGTRGTAGAGSNGANGGNGGDAGDGGEGKVGIVGNEGGLGGGAQSVPVLNFLTGGAGGSGGQGGGGGGGGGSGRSGSGGGGGGGEARNLVQNGSNGGKGGNGGAGAAGGAGGVGGFGGKGGGGGGAVELVAYRRLVMQGQLISVGGEGELAPVTSSANNGSPRNSTAPGGGSNGAGGAGNGAGGDGGDGGDGGWGKNGGAGGRGGAGGSGSGGGFALVAPVIDSDKGRLAVGGGIGAGVGRVLFSDAREGDFTGDDFDSQFEGANEGLLGLLEENPHLADRSATPYLGSLQKGTEVAGLLAGFNAIDFLADSNKGDSDWMAAYRVAASDLAGFDESFNDYDYLFLMNLTRGDLPDPVLGVGAGYHHRLIDGGAASNPFFGGSGYGLLPVLANSQVYVTLVPKTESEVCFGFRQNSELRLQVGSLLEGEVAYLSVPFPARNDQGAPLLVGESQFEFSPLAQSPEKNYEVSGSLTVQVLDEAGSLLGNALWSLDGEADFYSNNEEVTGVAIGNRTIRFESLTGYLPPRDQTIRVRSGTTETLQVTYLDAPTYQLSTDVSSTEVAAITRQVIEEGEYLGFFIEGAEGAQLSIIGTAPEGAIGFSGNWFSYRPSANDRLPFEVLITPVTGTPQSFIIEPRPQTLPEEEVINLRMGLPLPDETAADFQDVWESPIGVPNRRQVISGVHVVLDDLIATAGLSEVNVYADKVTVNGIIDLAGTDLTIFAKQLDFPTAASRLHDCGDVALHVLNWSGIPQVSLSSGATLISPFDPSEILEAVEGGFGNISQFASTPTGQPLTELPLGYRWLHPMALRQQLVYVDRLYYLGYYEEARERLADNLGWLQGLEGIAYQESGGTLVSNNLVSNLPDAGDSAMTDATLLAFSQIATEMEGLKGRLDDNLDYFGNPLGWTPMLSFETIFDLVEQEIQPAMEALYLSYWLGEKADDAEEINTALVNLRTRLRTENQVLRDEFEGLDAKRAALVADQLEIETDIGDLRSLIGEAEVRLEQRAEEIVTDRNFVPVWKKTLRIVGKVSQMVPVYQPALAAAGAGLDLITRLDEQDPLDSVLAAVGIAAEYKSAGYEAKADVLELALNGGDSESEIDSPQGLRDKASQIRSAANGINTAVEKVQEFLAEKEGPAGEIGEELRRLRASDPQLANLALRLEILNQQKVQFARDLAALESRFVEIPAAIQGNLLAMRSARDAELSNQDLLNPGALSHLKGMERRAEARLRQYLYWLSKAYEYRFLDSYANATVDGESAAIDLTQTFLHLKNLAEGPVTKFTYNETTGEADEDGLVSPDASNPHLLTADQFSSLRSVFTSELSNLANAILSRTVGGAGQETTTVVNFELDAEQLAELNETGFFYLNPVQANRLPENREQYRIAGAHPTENGPDGNPRPGGVRVVDVEYAADPNSGPVSVKFDVIHGINPDSGLPDSVRMTRAGRTYLFNPRREGENPVVWSSTLLTNGSFTFDQPSLASNSLLDAIVTDDGDRMNFSRPAADAGLEISRTVESGLGVELTKVTVEVLIDYVPKTTGTSEVEVRFLDLAGLDDVDATSRHQELTMTPRVLVSRADEYERQDGSGRLLRRYQEDSLDTEFTAEERYGLWEFVEWRQRTSSNVWQVYSDGGWTTDLSATGRPLTASVCHCRPTGFNNHHHRIFAIYRDLGDRIAAEVEGIALDVGTSNSEFTEYVVTFSEDVVGVDAADFLADGQVASSVIGTGNTRRVRVAGQPVSFMLKDDDSILDYGGNSLGGFGDFEDASEGDGTASHNGETVETKLATLSILSVSEATGIQLQLNSNVDSDWQLQWSQDMSENSWMNLQVMNRVGSDTYTHSQAGSGSPKGFYRVQALD